MRDGTASASPYPHRRTMTGRRLLFLTIAVLAFVALAGLMTATLSPGGFGALDVFILMCFIVTLPWTIIGFLNAVIGLSIMRLAKDPVQAVCPIAPGNRSAPLTSKTALLSCIRDEDVDRIEINLNTMLADLADEGTATGMSLYILSDTSRDDVAHLEKRMAERLARKWGMQVPVTYRRRTDNVGFKAGNVMDFCDRWGANHDYAIVLDADSVMSAETLVDLIRKMDANPKLGILQSLAVGLPAESAFTRIFQFGMRLGMRSYTIGSAWWQGDCGPYWGHNAILRIKPFMDHCQLPPLPGKGPLSGPILSHDQVEAVLMRRAGFDVRVLPIESGSYEENPPHLLEFIRRDLRWCQGNLQYKRLLFLPGLKPVSRVQLILAMLMFMSSPAWLGFMVGAPLLGLTADGYAPFRADTGAILFFTVLTMVFAPKIATMLDIASRKQARKGFGGSARVVLSTTGEIIYSAMLAPVMAIAHSLFIGGLVFGRATGWGAQARGLEKLPLRLAASKLWPQTLFGVFAISWIATQPIGFVWPVLPLALGTLFAIPLAIATSTKSLGQAAYRSTFWRIPEENTPPPVVLALTLPMMTAIGHTAPVPVPAALDAGVEPVAVEA
ncbi:MAG: glucans biosynthesis glucosyltransferase MdoH [Roseibium sp.]|nr:glucans biosynthesis glucosyltransferase MdoH [Roseibium sp.]